MDSCKYVHYEIDYRGTDLDPRRQRKVGKKKDETGPEVNRLTKLDTDEDSLSRKMLPPQVGTPLLELITTRESVGLQWQAAVWKF